MAPASYPGTSRPPGRCLRWCWRTACWSRGSTGRCHGKRVHIPVVTMSSHGEGYCPGRNPCPDHCDSHHDYRVVFPFPGDVQDFSPAAAGRGIRLLFLFPVILLMMRPASRGLVHYPAAGTGGIDKTSPRVLPAYAQH
jgi:hypothetical protein